MASILFAHNNFPAQFGAFAEALAGRGHRCRAIASTTGRGTASVPVTPWRLTRGTTPGLFPPATRAEADLLRGAAAAQAAIVLRTSGFDPDLIIAHPGWGESLFLRELFPRARQILYGEFYYRSLGADVGFDPEFGVPELDETMRIHGKNATGALAYMDADRIVSPTAFQRSLFPPALRDGITVLHEGIDLDVVRTDTPARVLLGDGTALDGTNPVVTFVNRRFEPMRGFHTFMRALPGLFDRVPGARAVLIGSDEPGGYGTPAGAGTTWKARMLTELGPRLDRSRVHFTGALPAAHMHALMRLGAAHVYLTYPFALSWSMLEAMALGCLVIGSRTAPVEEVITDGRNGFLVDMLDPAALTELLVRVCTGERSDFAPLRDGARRTIAERFDRSRVCRPAWLALIDEVLAERG